MYKKAGRYTAILLLFLSFSTISFAAMDPAEIERIKANAPLQLTVDSIKDELIEQPNDRNSPYQERKMTIEIIDIIKSSQQGKIEETIEVEYTYIPSWVEMAGGAKMDIAIADKIEIWLDWEGNTWQPSASGDTVRHIYYSEHHQDHIRQPITNKFSLPNIPPSAIVSFILISLFVCGWLITRKINH